MAIMDQRERNPVIELSRLIAMLLIVIGHMLGHGGVEELMSSHSYARYALDLLSILCTPATNVFILISSYFLCTSHFRIQRIVSLWLQVFFYNLAAQLLSLAAGTSSVSLGMLMNILFPISTNQYWFIRVFLGLLVFSPFLNLLIKSMSKKQHGLYVAVLVAVFSGWRNLLPFATTLNGEGGNSIMWFVTLYMIAAFIRKYVVVSGKTKKYVIASAAAYMVIVVGTYGIRMASEILGLGGKGSSLFIEFASVTMLAFSVSLFLLVLSVVPKFKPALAKGINCVAASTLSVYCIHEHPLLRKWVWNSGLIGWITSREMFILIRVFLAAALILITCLAVDKLTFDRFKRLIRQITFPSLQKKLDDILN